MTAQIAKERRLAGTMVLLILGLSIGCGELGDRSESVVAPDPACTDARVTALGSASARVGAPAEHVLDMHRRALAQLLRDSRWSDDAQRPFLALAVRHNVEQIEHAKARVEREAAVGCEEWAMSPGESATRVRVASRAP